MSIDTLQAMLATAIQEEPARPQPLYAALEPAQPYPVEALGYMLSNAARAIIDIVQCPPALAANSLLSTASLVVQSHANVVLPTTGQAKPTSVYVLSIAKSGERKTTADEEALAPIRAYESELNLQYAAEITAHENRKAAWEAEQLKITRDKKSNYEGKLKALDALGPKPEGPLLPILISSEPTFEGLCKLLLNSRPAQGIFSSEGGQFVGGHAMQDDAKLRSAAGLSDLWDGTPIKRVRSTDSVSMLHGRRLSVNLMIQPEAGGKFFSDPVLKDQGLLSRVLAVAPESTAGTRMQRPPHPNSRPFLAFYKAHMLKILRHPLPLVPGTRNELNPRELHLAEDAKQRLYAYADEIELQVRQYKKYDCISGFAGKMTEHALRIAGVLTLIEDINAPCITLETLHRAILITNYYASEALRLTNAGLTDPAISDAALLWDWICKEWNDEHISASVIEHRGPVRLRKKDRAHAALSKLAEHFHLIEAPARTLVDGKRVKKAWRIVKDTPANAANPANQVVSKSQHSQDSQGVTL